jgi:hypothetical protein
MISEAEGCRSWKIFEESSAVLKDKIPDVAATDWSSGAMKNEGFPLTGAAEQLFGKREVDWTGC